MYHTSERGACSAWRHTIPLYPAALPGEEGYYIGLYTDHSLEDALLQITARHACDRNHEAHALRFELQSTRAPLYRALTLLAPFVSVGSLKHDTIYHVKT